MQERNLEQQRRHLAQLKQLQERLLSQLASQTSRSEQGFSDEEFTGLLETVGVEKSPGITLGRDSHFTIGAGPADSLAAGEQHFSPVITPLRNVSPLNHETPLQGQAERDVGCHDNQTPTAPLVDPNTTIQSLNQRSPLDQEYISQPKALVTSLCLSPLNESEGFCTPSTTSTEFLHLPDLSSNSPHAAFNQILHQSLLYSPLWPHTGPEAPRELADNLSIQPCASLEIGGAMENQIRAALVEKHRKHVEDLQSYYESQISVLKGQLSSLHLQLTSRTIRSPVNLSSALASSPVKSRLGHSPATPLSNEWDGSASLKIQRLLAENGQLMARCMELENQLDEQYG